MKENWFYELSLSLNRGGKALTAMKLLLTVLFFFGFNLSATVVFGQENKLSINVNEEPISDVLAEIERQSDYRFAYSSQFVDTERKVSLELKASEIDEALTAILKDTDIGYSVENHFVVLLPKTEAELASAMAQNVQGNAITVSGRVVDNNDEPIPGVSVVLKGSQTGTITDIDGNYTISNVPESGSLVFSFVGMKTQEVPVSGRRRSEERRVGKECR